jgi:hypothetical protein
MWRGLVIGNPCEAAEGSRYFYDANSLRFDEYDTNANYLDIQVFSSNLSRERQEAIGFMGAILTKYDDDRIAESRSIPGPDSAPEDISVFMYTQSAARIEVLSDLVRFSRTDLLMIKSVYHWHL